MERKNFTYEALERTIEEETAERKRQRETGEVNPTVLMDMARYRGMQESMLDYEESTRVTIPRAITRMVTSPIGLLIESMLVYGLLNR